MSRYIGPRLRILRRLGKLRGLTRKKPFRRVFRGMGFLKGKVIPPGQHGVSKLIKSKGSDFLVRLKIKQRLRFNYGVTEKVLIKYMKEAKRRKESTGQALLEILERRLDNVVFRLNMAPTIPAARQIVAHGHIFVNGQKVNIPSYRCQIKDVISVASKKASLNLITSNLSEYYHRVGFYRTRMEKTLAFVVKKKMTWEINQAIEMITNGKILVNNQKVQLPNYIVKSQDVISLLSARKN